LVAPGRDTAVDIAARGVNDRADRAEIGDRAGDAARDIAVDGEVGRKEARVRPERRREGGALGLCDVRNRHAVARPDEGPNDLRSDAGRAAGDDGGRLCRQEWLLLVSPPGGLYFHFFKTLTRSVINVKRAGAA